VRERTRLAHPGSRDGGRFVLYWTATALRARDNPALDAARYAAHRAGLPLLVYQGLTHRAWYASDRTHTFLLESALSLGPALAALGIRHVLHLEPTARTTATPAPLVALARDAAMIFVEDFPTGDLPRWQARLAAASGRPVYAVDTACALPMALVGRAYVRAFAFREATEAARWARIEAAPDEDHAPRVPAWEAALPFEPTVLDPARIADVVASFAIDHGVGRLHDTPGGEAAAHLRWNTWRHAHLATYASRRTDAADPTGSSQMSAHLHFGTLAAWRMARDAVQTLGRNGAEKFCDELLTWRELGWCFCAHRPDHATVTALPDWARATLDATRDRRSVRPALDAIEHGTTGDVFFDLCQRSLVAHGALHNNTRMTWGKTLAAWFADPAEGLRTLEALNHRWALDGRDPNSYAGILWAYGQFDRAEGNDATGPLGAVRARSASAHLARVGAKRLHSTVTRSRGGLADVLIVGAGAAGAIAARILANHGVRVTVIDKGRNTGGRMATRRIGEARFDHGAAQFSLDAPQLAVWRAAWLDAGVIAAHPDGGFTCPAGATALVRHLLAGLDVRPATTVTRVSHDGQRVTLEGEGWRETAAAAVLTAPVAQSLALLDAGGVALPGPLRAELESIRYRRAVVAMVTSPKPAVLGPGVGRIVKQADHGWCLYAHDALAEARYDDDDAALAAALGVEALDLKRWRYARVADGTARAGPAVLCEAPWIVLAGDAFGGEAGAHVQGGVAAALRAGIAAAGRLLGADAPSPG